MQKIILGILTVLMLSAPLQTKAKTNWQEVTISTFLITAGAWLAHKQIPRITGRKIEVGYSPAATKALAIVFCAIGTAGIITGTYLLTKNKSEAI